MLFNKIMKGFFRKYGLFRGSKAVFAGGEVLALVLALTLAPVCAWATPVSTGDILQPRWLKGEHPFPHIFDAPQIYDGRIYEDHGNVEYNLIRLILDESWEEWLAFQRQPYRVIPLEALKRILRVDYVSTKLQPAPAQGESDGILEAARTILLPAETTWFPTKGGLVSHDGEGSRKFSPFEWLIQEEGLFSGRPWDWENFLPRLLTIGGLVVLGLLLTEGLHYLFGLGARVMGLRQRRDSTEAP
jgi:hypothetical protein